MLNRQRRKRVDSDSGCRRWLPAEGAVWCTEADLTVILSLDTGQYHTLNEVGGRIWRYVCENRHFDEITELVASDYGITESADSVRRDITDLLFDLEKRRLIRRGTIRPREVMARELTASAAKGKPSDDLGPIHAVSPPVPTMMACLARLTTIYVALRAAGLRRVLSHVCVHPSNTRRDVPRGWLQQTARRVAVAGVLCPFRIQCLERSLCVLWFAHRAGVDARLRMGFVPYPFQGHAWVECESEPINDDPEHLRLFRAFPPLESEGI